MHSDTSLSISAFLPVPLPATLQSLAVVALTLLSGACLDGTAIAARNAIEGKQP